MRPNFLDALRHAVATGELPPPVEPPSLVDQLTASLEAQGGGGRTVPYSHTRRSAPASGGQSGRKGTLEEALGEEALQDPIYGIPAVVMSTGGPFGGITRGPDPQQVMGAKMDELDAQERAEDAENQRVMQATRARQAKVEAALAKEVDQPLPLEPETLTAGQRSYRRGAADLSRYETPDSREVPANPGARPWAVVGYAPKEEESDGGMDVGTLSDHSRAETAGDVLTGTPRAVGGQIVYDLPVVLDHLPLFCSIRGQAGCLSGQTTIQYSRGARGGHRPLYLAEFYRKFNGLPTKDHPFKDLTFPTFLQSLGEDGVMFYNKVVAVLESGVKPLVRIELEGETYLRATPDHPILTPHGFVPAGDLKEGDMATCRGTMLPRSNGGRDLSARPPRVIVNLKYHPYGAYKLVEGQYEYTRVARARLVVEAGLNDLSYDEFVHILKHNEGVAGTLRYLPTDFDVHHDDENTLNDEWSNLVVLPKAEHARLHNQRGNFRFDSVREVKVKGIASCEEEMTYDIQMEAPANNFCANGIVVHNTGKTFWAKALADQNEGCVLAATTGIAAVNLGEGTTINSYLKFFNTASLVEAFTGGWLEALLTKHRRAGMRRILLDEVSMLDGDQLTVLCRAVDNVNQSRKDGEDPEIGLILIGDFAQLPPVKAPFAFESPEWERFKEHTLGLKTIRRQADLKFIQALQAVRLGHHAEALDFFQGRFSETTLQQFDGPTLLAKNDAVERYNQLRLDKVPGAKLEFTSSRWGELRREWGGPPKPVHDWGVPEVLKLKVGARVMLLANCNVAEKGDPPEFLYVNGDLATVLDQQDGPLKGLVLLVRLDRTGEDVKVGQITRENQIPLEPGRLKQLKAQGKLERISKDRKHEVVGAITYMPVRLCWGTTVHKAQGLSLTSLQVNIRDPFFSQPGMLYVALSRCRTAEGLRLVGNAQGFRARCTVSPKVVPWL